MHYCIIELITINKINAVKNFNAGKITQTSGTNSEHKYNTIEHLWTLNEHPSSSTVNKFSDLH